MIDELDQVMEIGKGFKAKLQIPWSWLNPKNLPETLVYIQRLPQEYRDRLQLERVRGESQDIINHYNLRKRVLDELIKRAKYQRLAMLDISEKDLKLLEETNMNEKLIPYINQQVPYSVRGLDKKPFKY